MSIYRYIVDVFLPIYRYHRYTKWRINNSTSVRYIEHSHGERLHCSDALLRLQTSSKQTSPPWWKYIIIMDFAIFATTLGQSLYSVHLKVQSHYSVCFAYAQKEYANFSFSVRKCIFSVTERYLRLDTGFTSS